MNADERQLIEGLFQRMRGVGSVEKDRDADALISQSVRQIPDSPYMLVQSVLVQEHALQQAGQRIEELEERVRQLEEQAMQAPAPGPAQSGGFLGGLFGGGAPATRPQQPMGRGAVPAMGAGRPMGAASNARPGSPWGQPQGVAAGRPQGGFAGQPMQQPMAQAGGGGGFMKSAMATAAGVAGGMLLANSISGMLSGNTGAAQAATPAENAAYDPNATTGGQDAQAQDASNDPGNYDPNAGADDAQYQDAANNDPGYDDGGDFGGGDFEL